MQITKTKPKNPKKKKQIQSRCFGKTFSCISKQNKKINKNKENGIEMVFILHLPNSYLIRYAVGVSSLFIASVSLLCLSGVPFPLILSFY